MREEIVEKRTINLLIAIIVILIIIIAIIVFMLFKCQQDIVIMNTNFSNFSNQTNQTIQPFEISNCSVVNELKDLIKESAISNLSTDNKDTKTFYVNGWIDDFAVYGSVTNFRKGTSAGENINYWYCVANIFMAKDIIDPNGIVIENIRKKVVKLVLDQDFNVTDILCQNCTQIENCDFRSLLSSKEELCKKSGGTITTQLCCNSVKDIPDTCLVGACGCSEENSHEVKVCNCGEEKCWDSKKVKCVDNTFT